MNRVHASSASSWLRSPARSSFLRTMPTSVQEKAGATEHAARVLTVPLLSAPWSRKLDEGLPVTAARRHLEHEQVRRLLALAADLTLDVLWRWKDQKELVPRQRDSRGNFLPEEPLTHETLPVMPRQVREVAAS